MSSKKLTHKIKETEMKSEYVKRLEDERRFFEVMYEAGLVVPYAHYNGPTDAETLYGNGCYYEPDKEKVLALKAKAV